jgi:hypothetical protein
MVHQRPPVTRGGLRVASIARHFHLGVDRLHQLVGDEHQAAADVPLRRDAGALMKLAQARN